MYTTNLETFKTQENELHRQASRYRLARSINQNKPLVNRISESLGRILILSGQQLINNARAAAH
jgi:hypothetical protein